MRMTPRYIIAALQLLLDKNESKAVSSTIFATEYCAPLRMLEVVSES